MAIGELIDLLGRVSVEAVLELSTRGVAGNKQQVCSAKSLSGVDCTS